MHARDSSVSMLTQYTPVWTHIINIMYHILGLNASHTINAYPNLIDTTAFTYDPFFINDNKIMSQWLLSQLCSEYAISMQSQYNTTTIPNTCNQIQYKNQDSIYFAIPYNMMGQTGNTSKISTMRLNVDKLSIIPQKLLELQMQIEQQVNPLYGWDEVDHDNMSYEGVGCVL